MLKHPEARQIDGFFRDESISECFAVRFDTCTGKYTAEAFRIVKTGRIISGRSGTALILMPAESLPRQSDQRSTVLVRPSSLST